MGGGQRIDSFLRDAIEKYLVDNSNVASNRTVLFEGVLIPARYLHETQEVIYTQFPLKDSVSKSCFLDYLLSRKQFKKAYRFTDLCEYCEWAREAKVELSKILRHFSDFQYGDKFDSVCIENMTSKFK